MTQTTSFLRPSAAFAPGRSRTSSSSRRPSSPLTTFGPAAVIAAAVVVAAACGLDIHSGTVDTATETDLVAIAAVADQVRAANPGKTLDPAALTQDLDASGAVPDASWAILESTARGYCLVAWNASGDRYDDITSPLTFDSTTGGIGRNVGACSSAPLVL